MCPRTLSDRHDQTETDRALWFVSTGPQRTNSSLQTYLRSTGFSVSQIMNDKKQLMIFVAMESEHSCPVQGSCSMLIYWTFKPGAPTSV